MKKSLLFIALTAISAFSFAQTFSNTPGDTINVNLPDNFYSELPIYQNNLTGDTLQLGIEVVYNDVPAGWDGMICVYGQCLGTILPVGSTASQSDVWGSNQGMVRLTVNPFNDTNPAMLRIYCYDVNFPNQGDTLTWILNNLPTGVEGVDEAAAFNIYPNPANGVFTMSNINDNALHFEVMDISGKVVLTQNCANLSTISINIEQFEAGLYQVRLVNKDGSAQVSKLIVQ